MTMYKALYTRDNFDRLYESRKEEGRGLVSSEYCIDASIQQLEDYIRKRGGKFITDTRSNNDNKTNYNNQKKILKKNNTMDVFSD